MWQVQNDNSQFCPHCGVSNDLHDGPDTCHIAEQKAQVISMFGRF